MTIDDMIKELETLGRRKSDPMLIKNALFYFGSIMMNKYKLRKSISGMSDQIRYFSVLFMPSGTGKDFILNQIQKICHLETYGAAMQNQFDAQLAQMREPPEDAERMRRFLPKAPTLSIDGSREALFEILKAQSFTDYGSINLVSSELGDMITQSSDLISKLKEIYDGTYKAKLVKGSAEAGGLSSDINNIICNFIGFGSRHGYDKDAQKELLRIVASGLYRRSFILDLNQPVEANEHKTNIAKTKQWLEDINITFRESALARIISNNIIPPEYFEYSSDFEQTVNEIDSDILAYAADNRLDQFAQYSTGSLEIIIDAAHIVAFLEGKTTVTTDHLAYAYDFYKSTRKSVLETFTQELPYKSMYRLLKLKCNLTITEMIELDSSIPSAKTKLDDNIAMLNELCYRNSELLKQSKGKVVRYAIEPLPQTNLSKLICSINDEFDKAHKAINYKPFEFEWEDIKKMCTSEKQCSFTLCHYEPSNRAIDGHRRAESAIEGQNLIGFDIDNGLSIKEAISLFSEYTFYIYTTKSHQIAKNGGEICDRFRILFPTKVTFYVTPEQHKTLYENVEVFLDLKNNDTQTRNISRLFFTNSAAIFTHSNEGDLLNVEPLIPDTNSSDHFMPIMNNLSTDIEYQQMNKREQGFIKWFFGNTSDGNRNGNLYRLANFFNDLGHDWWAKTEEMNAMLSEPVKEHELHKLLKNFKPNKK